MEQGVIITEEDLRKALAEVQADLLEDERLDRMQKVIIAQMVAMIGIRITKELFDEHEN